MEIEVLRNKVVEECERCFAPRPLIDEHRNLPNRVRDSELCKYVVDTVKANITNILYKKFNERINSISNDKKPDSEVKGLLGKELPNNEKIKAFIKSTLNGYASTRFRNLFKNGLIIPEEEKKRTVFATDKFDARTIRKFINRETIPDEKTLDLFSIFLQVAGWNTFKHLIREQQRLNGDNPITPIINIPQSKPSSLKRLQIPGATIIDEVFIENVRKENFSVVDFYIGLKHSQWNGIINNCDVERKDTEQLKDAVMSSFSQKRLFKIAALVTGTRGSGKSTVLRRLCIDIQGFNLCKIIWIDNAIEFVQHGFSNIKKEIEVNIEQKYLIVIEDWFHIFENKKEEASEILEKLNSIENFRIVIGDKTIVGKPYEKYGADIELQLSSKENKYILDQIIKKNPDWRGASEKLFKNPGNYQSSLFLLLFVLARIAHDKKDTDNNINFADPLVVFRNIIKADVNHIASKKLGLAKALYYWGFMYAELKTPISYKTFLLIADFFHGKGNAKISDFYKRWNADDEVLDILKLYIYKDDEECVRFHHNIMTDYGFNKITKEEWAKFGSEIKLDLLDIITNKGDDYSASIFLADMLKKDRNVFTDKDEKLKYVDLLLLKNSTSGYHLEMLPSIISTYAQIEKYAEILWERELFSISFWDFVLNINNNEKSKLWSERILSHNKIENISLRIINECLNHSRDASLNNFLEKFLSGNYWINTPYLFPPILYKLKKNSKVQNFVKNIINDINWRDQEWYMVTSSIKICNDSDLVENFCNQLLVDENWQDTNSFIIATALIRANREVRSDFVSMILKEVEINKIGFATAILCIQLCPNKKLQEETVENLLKNKLWKKENPEGVIRILELDIVDNEFKQDYYKDVLKNENWRNENPEILYISLNSLSESNEDLKVNFADKILNNKEYCISNEYTFLLSLELSKDEALKIRSANDFIANVNLDSPRYKYIIKDLLKLTKDQKTALYYLKEWLICDWKYEDVDDKIDNYLMCFENTEELPKEIDMIIEQVSNDYLDDDKLDEYWIYIRSLYEKLIQLNLCGSFTWKREVDKIIKNWDKKERYFITSILMNYLDEPEKIKYVCSSILLNWEREKGQPAIRLMAGGFRYGTHLKIALGHPNLRSLAKETAEKILLLPNYMYNEFYNEPLIAIATQIVENDIYPEWEISNS